MEAVAIVGLLADADRRRCWAAVELGATTPDAVIAAAGLSAQRVTTALGRLASGGLVVAAADGALVSAGEAIQAAARAALQRPDSDEHDNVPADARKVMRSFVAEGRIIQIPTSAAKRRVLLDWLAQDFEPGVRYSEAMVNMILGQRHADTAALRRYLVDEGLLDRDAGQYWRAGGAVPV